MSDPGTHTPNLYLILHLQVQKVKRDIFDDDQLLGTKSLGVTCGMICAEAQWAEGEVPLSKIGVTHTHKHTYIHTHAYTYTAIPTLTHTLTHIYPYPCMYTHRRYMLTHINA